MIVALAAALLVAGQTVPPTPPQAGAPLPAAQSDPREPVRLEDVEVTGRPLRSMVRAFVNEVAAPNPRRGIARWNGTVCIGVANLRAETAQYLVDRASTVAEDLGLRPGRPGCRPNVLIIATDQPDALSTAIIRENRRQLRPGGSGMDRGNTALRAFEASDRPVRWWQVSMPIDSDTGAPAVRLPGQDAPVIAVRSASRLSTQIVDAMFRMVIILDIDQVSRVSGRQLADYVAMISMAQINPDADTSAYASILNLFEDPAGAQGLTDWDRAYLEGLYQTERTRKNLRSGRLEIASSILRAHRNLQADTTN